MSNRTRDRYLAALCFTLAALVSLALILPGTLLLLFAATTYVIENWIGQLLPAPPPVPNSAAWLNAARNAAERSRMIGEGLRFIALGLAAPLPYLIVRRRLLRTRRDDPQPSGDMLR